MEKAQASQVQHRIFEIRQILASRPFPHVENIKAAEELVNSYQSVFEKLAEIEKLVIANEE